MLGALQIKRGRKRESVTDKGDQIQGHDPKAEVFAGLASILYAAYEAVCGAYTDQSRICATIADTLVGLRGKRVLDLGSGYGITTQAIARHDPRQIMAIEMSEQHCELFKTVLQRDTDIAAYLDHKGAREVLEDLYAPTVAHLNAMRHEFAGGVFSRNGGQLSIVNQSALLYAHLGLMNMFDAVVGNNSLHWLINQSLSASEHEKTGESREHAVRNAVRHALRSTEYLLRPGGVAVFLEVKDFIRVVEDADCDRDLEQATMASHPVFLKLHGLLNRLLKEKHDIDRPIPTTTGLLRTDELPAMFASAGLRYKTTVFVEGTLKGDAVDVFTLGIPMLVGGLKLPFEDKLALIKRVRRALPELVTAGERSMPVRAQYFVLVAEKPQAVRTY